jgi:large subunit ribosomal protein L24
MYSPPKKKGPRRNNPKFTGKMRLRVGDTVRVLAGKDKGKEGKIARVIPSLGQVVVEGINIVIKHQKARPQANPTISSAQQQSGRVEIAAPLNAAKVQLVDGNSVSRIGYKTDASGERVRYAKKSGGVIDNG